MTDYCELLDVAARVGRDPDVIFQRFIAAASRNIDNYCLRRFWLDDAASARRYTAHDVTDLVVDDFATTTGLIVTATVGGTPTTFTLNTDFQSEPLNQVHAGIEGHAFERLVALAPKQWPIDHQGKALVSVTAQWGWPAIPAEITALCIDVAARAVTIDLAVKSETMGGYSVTYAEATQLTEREQEVLTPYRKEWP